MELLPFCGSYVSGFIYKVLTVLCALLLCGSKLLLLPCLLFLFASQKLLPGYLPIHRQSNLHFPFRRLLLQQSAHSEVIKSDVFFSTAYFAELYNYYYYFLCLLPFLLLRRLWNDDKVTVLPLTWYILIYHLLKAYSTLSFTISLKSCEWEIWW